MVIIDIHIEIQFRIKRFAVLPSDPLDEMIECGDVRPVATYENVRLGAFDDKGIPAVNLRKSYAVKADTHSF